MDLLKIFKDYRQFEIFVLGIISGLPLSILYSTILAWFTDENISLEVITTFAISRIAYSLKFIWSPIVDYFKIPILGRFGHRKSWLIFCASVLGLILFTMGKLPPAQSLPILYVLTILFGFFAATFDISLDAFRIEKFEAEFQGMAAANAVMGYRIGMIITNAGALYFAQMTGSWPQTFMAIGFIYAIAVIFILTVKEQPLLRGEITNFSLPSIVTLVVNPFKDFLKRDSALVILLAVILYKLGEAMLGVVTMPFYLKEMGFDKGQIATGVKLYGLFATLLGVYAGGILVYRMGHVKALIIGGLAQSLTHVTFIWLHHQGANFNALVGAVAIENFAGGIGSSALVAYLSILCNKKFAATQFALLSSGSSFFNNSVTMYGGTLVTMLGWDEYFIFTIFLGFPGILLLIYLNKKFSTKVG